MNTGTKCRRCDAAVPADVEYCPVCGLSVTGDREAGVASVQGQDVPNVRSSAREQVLLALRDATLGEYEILGELGRGGMATVFLAHEIALNRKVAIKVILPQLIADTSAERFLREARTAAGLSHPNLIPIYSVRETESMLFFVMKYVVGPSLETLLSERRLLSFPLVQAILGETAAALGYAHGRQIVHRDVKPGNIMLDEGGRVVVTDFGIARDSESTGLTSTGMSVGTPMYMSPEQCQGEPVSGASDQYSLGIVGYQMVAGKVPFEASSAVAMMYAQMYTPARPLLEARPDCPPPLAAAIMRMLQKSPADRWPTIEDAGKAVGAPPLAPDDPVRRELAELARAGAAKKQSSLPSTPRSPIPSARVPRLHSPRGVVPPAHASLAVAEAGTLEAPTAPLASRAAQGGGAHAARGQARRWWRRPAVVGAFGLTTFAVWYAATRRPVVPPPVSPPAIVSQSPPAVAGDQERTKAPEAAQAAPVSARAPAVPAVREPVVERRIGSVAISPPVSQLRVGEQVQLRASPLDAAGHALSERGMGWTTSDARVASVTSGGLVHGLAEGNAVITASLNGNSASISLAVVPVPAAAPAASVASVEVIPSTLTVQRGATGQLRAIVHDATGRVLTDRAVRWTSAGPQTADVSTSGLVIGIAPGTTQISAGVEGRTAAVVVTVPTPAAPAPAAPPPDPRPAIRRLVDAYVAAIRARNVTRIIAIYPTLSPASRSLWDKLFDDYPDVSATLVPASIDIPASGETAAFDVSMELSNGREHQKILMHFLANPELADGAWRFRQIVQSYVKQ